MNNEYKTIPFAEVKIGQQFEFAEYHKNITNNCWTKINEKEYQGVSSPWKYNEDLRGGCLVRIADCEPELDTCTWTYKEYAWESACGAEFIFTDEQDSLELNSFKFCHKCGCKIVEAK